MFCDTSVIALVAGVLLAVTAGAQAPAGAPAGSTGMCRDGSYWTGATKKGACHGHKGVQDWYASADAAAGGSPAASNAATPTAAPSAPSAPSAPAPVAPAAAAAVAPAMPAKPATTMATAPGGGAGEVWVNLTSKVYHCPSDRYYGKTKNGTYMTEADAVAKGNHADHGKTCKSS